MRLFVDMDGTIAKWNNVAFEDLYQEGYYKNLEPDSAILDEVKMLIELNIDVYILSAYLPDIYDDNTGELIKKSYALQDKQEWIEKYLPEINKDNVIFVPKVNPKNIRSPQQLIEKLKQEGYEYSIIDEIPPIVDVYLDDCTVTYYIKEKECTIPDIEIYSNADTIASVSLENAEKLFDDIQDAVSYLNNDTIDNDYHRDY